MLGITFLGPMEGMTRKGRQNTRDFKTHLMMFPEERTIFERPNILKGVRKRTDKVICRGCFALKNGSRLLSFPQWEICCDYKNNECWRRQFPFFMINKCSDMSMEVQLPPCVGKVWQTARPTNRPDWRTWLIIGKLPTFPITHFV